MYGYCYNGGLRRSARFKGKKSQYQSLYRQAYTGTALATHYIEPFVPPGTQDNINEWESLYKTQSSDINNTEADSKQTNDTNNTETEAKQSDDINNIEDAKESPEWNVITEIYPLRKSSVEEYDVINDPYCAHITVYGENGYTVYGASKLACAYYNDGLLKYWISNDKYIYAAFAAVNARTLNPSDAIENNCMVKLTHPTNELQANPLGIISLKTGELINCYSWDMKYTPIGLFIQIETDKFIDDGEIIETSLQPFPVNLNDIQILNDGQSQRDIDVARIILLQHKANKIEQKANDEWKSDGMDCIHSASGKIFSNLRAGVQSGSHLETVRERLFRNFLKQRLLALINERWRVQNVKKSKNGKLKIISPQHKIVTVTLSTEQASLYLDHPMIRVSKNKWKYTATNIKLTYKYGAKQLLLEYKVVPTDPSGQAQPSS